MRKKNVITMIGMIVMIISVFVLFNGQLSAEEEMGRSIFPKIETPHPYPQTEGNQTLVWSTTIDQPGATWIKIHFSGFQLNDKDIVNLIDENDKIVEQIQFSDVHGKYSRFNLQKNDNQTVNFWTMSVDGQKLRIELHRESTGLTGRGFTIDEIGIGSKSIYEGELEPISNIDTKTGTDSLPLLERTGSTKKIGENII